MHVGRSETDVTSGGYLYFQINYGLWRYCVQKPTFSSSSSEYILTTICGDDWFWNTEWNYFQICQFVAMLSFLLGLGGLGIDFHPRLRKKFPISPLLYLASTGAAWVALVW